jgi:sialic acid synthase SpsE
MTKIIAEAGINHQGSLDRAKEYVLSAARAGADRVKFHMAYADRMVNLAQKEALWNDKHPISGESLSKFVKRVELSIDDLECLKGYAKDVGIGLMASCYDLVSIEQALEIGITEIKLASCDFIRHDFIKLLNNRAEYVYLATGMATHEEMLEAKKIIDPYKTTVMHCVSIYPTPTKLANLNQINLIKKMGWNAGYSDHNKGISMCVASLQFHPSWIEKHFMLESDLTCPDANVSCIPRELSELVDLSHNYQIIFGSEEKLLSPLEFENRSKFRGRW